MEDSISNSEQSQIDALNLFMTSSGTSHTNFITVPVNPPEYMPPLDNMSTTTITLPRPWYSGQGLGLVANGHSIEWRSITPDECCQKEEEFKEPSNNPFNRITLKP